MKLLSGKELTTHPADFEVAKALYMTLMEEARGLKIDGKDDINANLLKDVLCTALSSKKVEAAVWKCMEKCLYEGSKITKETFEPVEARADYLEILLEVALENVTPFTKTLTQKFSALWEKLQSSLA